MSSGVLEGVIVESHYSSAGIDYYSCANQTQFLYQQKQNGSVTYSHTYDIPAETSVFDCIVSYIILRNVELQYYLYTHREDATIILDPTWQYDRILGRCITFYGGGNIGVMFASPEMATPQTSLFVFEQPEWFVAKHMESISWNTIMIAKFNGTYSLLNVDVYNGTHTETVITNELAGEYLSQP